MTRRIGTLRWCAALSWVGLAFTTPAQAQVSRPAASQEPPTAQAVKAAAPMQRALPRLPREVFRAAPPFMPAQPPETVAGYGGPSATSRKPGNRPVETAPPEEDPFGAGTAPQNYGAGNLNSLYHYSDRLVDAELDDNPPWRWAGRFTFVTATGETRYCSSALIARSILVTAGHCVHQGGDLPGRTKDKGWNKSGVYTPVFRNGTARFGSATAAQFFTTSGWYNTGGIDEGYDVGLVVLNKRTGTAREIGVDTGFFGFCHTNCLQPYLALSQLGYPSNYYAGTQMTQSEHLERSDTRDLLFGTGMRGGSSGGPHIVNLGLLTDSARDKGQLVVRNSIYAVTSWGYISEGPKIQGASSLSGPGNANNFKALFNQACTKSRALHGAASCTLL